MADMDAHIFSVDVLIAQMTYLPDTKTRGIHKGAHGPWLDVRHGGNKKKGFLLRRDIGEIGIRLAQRELSRIPGVMKNIQRKEAELGNTEVDRTAREIFSFWSQRIKSRSPPPGNILGKFVKDVREVGQISLDVSGIRPDCVVSEATEGDHLPELF